MLAGKLYSSVLQSISASFLTYSSYMDFYFDLYLSSGIRARRGMLYYFVNGWEPSSESLLKARLCLMRDFDTILRSRGSPLHMDLQMVVLVVVHSRMTFEG